MHHHFTHLQNLRDIAANPRNTVAANNKYDAEYVKYFTGLKDVPVMPNYCGYTGVSYDPQKTEILIGPGKVSSQGEGLMREMKSTGQTVGMDFKGIRELYPHFEVSERV